MAEGYSGGKVDTSIQECLQSQFKQSHFKPLKTAPEGWSLDGKYFPLGPNSKAKGDWYKFWQQVEVHKKIVAAMAASPTSPQPELSAQDAVQDMIDNMCTHVLATVYCPAWAHGWARMLLSLVVSNVATCEHLMLIALKGGFASDEECAFVFVLLLELGFTCTGIDEAEDDDSKCLINATFHLTREGAKAYKVQLWQYNDMVNIRNDLVEDFAPSAGFTSPPNLQRVAVVSCAEKWFVNGETMRVNPAETDADHPEGMTVNDKLNAELVLALGKTKRIARARGFRPFEDDEETPLAIGCEDQTPEQNALVEAYFAPLDDDDNPDP